MQCFPAYGACRSLELQSDLIAAAAQLCYTTTERDLTPERLVSAKAAAALDAADAPLNSAALAAFGGPPRLLACLSNCASEHARRCLVSVLLDAARRDAMEKEAALTTFLQTLNSSRCVRSVSFLAVGFGWRIRSLTA